MTQATDTRELIVESAYACFGTQGLQKATIVDIAKTAGVSRSTIYEYFSDKAAILEACAERASERFYREMSKAMDQGSSLEDKLPELAHPSVQLFCRFRRSLRGGRRVVGRRRSGFVGQL
jgi:AcrR family transcriptional regulator